MRLRKRQLVKYTITVLLVCALTEFAYQISFYHVQSRARGLFKEFSRPYCDDSQECIATSEEDTMDDIESVDIPLVTGNMTNLTGLSFPSHIFPPRSPKELNDTLQKSYNIMEPIIQEIEGIRKIILSTESIWEKPSHPSNVLLSNGDYFLRKLNRLSVDILHNSATNASGSRATPKPQIRTINVRATKAELEGIFKPTFFMDYASNDCNNMERGTVHGKKMGKRMFSATCSMDVDEAWKPKPFQSAPFRIGQPEKPKKNSTHLLIGYIHVIKNGAVDTNGDACAGKLKIVIRRYSMTKSVSIAHPSNSHIYNEVFSIAQFWGSGFYHGTIEDFTRIAPYLSFLRKHRQIKIHVKTRTGFIKGFTEFLGISPGRIVSGSVGARILYVPAGTSCGRSAIFPTYMLSAEFRSRITTPVHERRSIVIIKRTTKRRFTHHHQILKMLQRLIKTRPQLKLKVEVYPDNPVPGLKETLAMLNRAFIVIAPHGAGEANLLFSEPGTVMIEGLCKSGMARAILCYRNLAQVLGHRYYGILSRQSCYTATPQTIEAPLLKIMSSYFK